MKNFKIIITLVTVIFAFAGCNSCNPKTNQIHDTIKIGVILPLTGPVAEPGNNVLKGIQISADNFNNASSDRKIELVVEDSKSNPKDGVSAIKKLIDADKVELIIGDLMSSVFLAIAPIAEKNKIVMISPGASNPAVRDAGDYIFRIYSSDDYDGRVMAEYIFKEMSIENAAILHVNNDYGIGLANTFSEKFKTFGGVVPLQLSYSEGQTDFKTIVTRIKQAKAKSIYIVGNPAENGHVVRELKNQNVNIAITGNLSFENETFISIAGNSFDSIIYSSPYFDISSNNEYTLGLVERFKSKYGESPNVEVGLGYDVLGIILFALKSSNYDLNTLKQSLYSIQNFKGITGEITYDELGDVKKTILIKRIDKSANSRVLAEFIPK